jgi:hypothetical protein
VDNLVAKSDGVGSRSDPLRAFHLVGIRFEARMTLSLA